MSIWRATGLPPRDGGLEALELGELMEWLRQDRRAQARRRAQAMRGRAR